MAKQPNVRGKVVAITGAARGIGLETAKAFIREGAVVAIGDVDAKLAAETGERIGASAYGVDISDLASFSRFLDQIERDLGPVDILVNNAGIMPLGPLAEEPDSVTERILSINLHGTINGTKLAMQRMVPRGRGHIINVSSTTGRFAVMNAATYSASKYGVIGLTQAARSELYGTGVHASVVLPTMTNTELLAGVKESKAQRAEPQDIAEAILEVVAKPVFETTVPRKLKRSGKIMSLLPYSWMESMARRMGGDALVHLDPQARGAYEERARAGSAGGEESTAKGA